MAQIYKRSVVKYICSLCGEIYDESETGIPFNELPEDWICPNCGAPKECYVELE